AAAEQAGTELKARRILYRSREGVVEAFQQASVSRGASRLGADSLFYDRETGAVATFGASELAEAGSQTKGFDLQYDLERKSGRLGGGVTTYEPWILEGAAMSKIGASTFMLDTGYFTTCDLPDPHYTFRADEIKLRQDDVIVARPVILYFSDIPVFYLPWYVEPVTKGRSSGFLRPKIGLNSLIFGSGKERNVQDIGYYYVFNEYADAKISADWYTESRFVLRGDFRYHLRHEFRGSAHVEQVWNRLDDRTSRLLRFSHDQEFGLNSRLNVDVNWSNSRSFLRRNSFDPEEILQRSFRSAASYSHRFDWGSFVSGADADFQLESNRIDFRLPDLRVSINQRSLWGADRRGGVTEDQPWYTRLQYSANASFLSRLSRAQVDSLGNPVNRVPTDSLGRALETDRETVLNQQQGRAQFTLNGPLDLFGVLKTTPSLNYAMSVENDALAEDESFGGRGQLGAGLNMSTRFFRVFRSVPGRWFTAMRHTVSPSASFRYSPRPQLFGSAAEADGGARGRESFTANFSVGQDFEVKMPVDGGEAGAVEDTGGALEGDEGGTPGEEIRAEEPETRSIQLLSVTNSMSFDFMRQWEEGELGFGNLSTRLSTGLGRDFSLSMNMEHELVERGTGEEDDEFSPFLSRITTDFSLRRGRGASVDRRREVQDVEVQAGRGADEETAAAQENLTAGRAPGSEGFGPWSLSLTHQWSRSRDGESNRQSLGIGAQLLPSANWSLNYRTTYDITNGELQGQTLSLVRDLHDWQATLGVNLFPSEPQDRVLISFAVFLRDVPDLEVPYRVRRE
ncbi:MAG: putative LPS assembly protein LptD, partial [Halobacteriales archaeon]|nr:putative LPS assembly protein LptD [Halobacteriales archaeon]